MPDEKRRYPRVRCEIDSCFDDLNGAKCRCVVQDISEGGIRFRTGDFVLVGTRLSLTLNIPEKKSIEVNLCPVWINEKSDVKQYEVGSYFISLSNEGRNLIHDAFFSGRF